LRQLPRRLMYFGYYLRRMDWAQLRRFMAHVEDRHGLSPTAQWRWIVRDSLRFNISILEWYMFRFFELDDAEKEAWAGTGTMYEFQRRANPPGARAVLEDKRRFYRAYRDFFRHELYDRDALAADPALVRRLLEANDRLVFKDATGNCGASVVVRPTSELDPATLVDRMTAAGHDMVETFVRQHDDLNALSPSGVNTVRVFTLIDGEDNYSVLGCRLRISVDSPVDNLAAGNLAAPVDEKTGMVSGPGVYSDITRPPEPVHPVTGVPIEGFRVPFWAETLQMVRDASVSHRENRSIGWDVVVTPDGPGLIEGNHDWCKLVWQLPVRHGLKSMINPP